MQPREFFASEHDIDSKLIDADALHVLVRLREAGFTAYLVGGSVRDLLRKQRPKDYDISTSARPEQVKSVFGRQCILIGKRFRLAHVRFGRKVFEVATFRAGENESDLIIHDNEWGSPEEDALRRDFTINGLFYDPVMHTVIDYVGGWEDIHKKVLRSIGDPLVRFKQDPVRMLRLIKFRVRCGFEIDSITEQALEQCKEEITKSSYARILEEMLRMLESGYSAPFFDRMLKSGMLHVLMPQLAEFLQSPHGQSVNSYLTNADKICQAYGAGTINRGVLTACLLFPYLEQQIQEQYLSKSTLPNLGDIMLMSTGVIKDLLWSAFSHFPRRLSAMIGFILATQYRLTPFSHKKHMSLKLLHHKEFILALKFLKVRSLVDPRLDGQYLEWKKLFKQIDRRGEHKSHSHHSSMHSP